MITIEEAPMEIEVSPSSKFQFNFNFVVDEDPDFVSSPLARSSQVYDEDINEDFTII